MNSFYKESAGDIQTDAELDPSEYEFVSSQQAPLHESTSGARPKVRQSSNNPSLPSNNFSLPSSLVYAQSARPITSSDDTEYLKYISHMKSPELQEDNIDILIINADKDKKAAENFKNHLKKDILFYINDKPRIPRVKLLHEIRYGSMDHLDLAFSKALYIFLFVTKEFCAEPWTLLQGQACLTEAIHDQNKKWCVVPIHTTSRKKQLYKLPMMLNSLRPINYWSGGQDQFYSEGVRKLLESKTGILLERERLLDEARRKYFNEHRLEILKDAKYDFMPQSSASSSSPLNCPVIAKEEQPASQSSYAVSQTDVYRNSSLPDQHSDKALPGNSAADLIVRVEKIAVSEEQTLPQYNTLHVNIKKSSVDYSELANRQVTQQPVSLNAHTSSIHIEHSNPISTNNNNNNIEQVTSNAPILTARELDSLVEVDGPEDEEPSSFSDKQNTAPIDYNHKIISNTNVPSSAHTGIAFSAPTDNTYYVPAGMSTMAHPSALRMHNPIDYGTPNQGTCFIDNMGRPTYMPIPHYPGQQPQFWYPNYVGDPNLNPQSLYSHQYPSLHNMQELYVYANPLQGLFYNTIRPPSHQTNEPTSYIESPQISTEANASDSLRPSLSHSSSTGVLSGVNSSGIYNQWPPHPQFPPWSSAQFQPHPFSHSTGRLPTSTPLTSQQVRTAPLSMSRQQQSHIQCPEQQETPATDQLGTRRTLSTANIQSSANSVGAFSGDAGSAANSVIQHIHHHHHEKKITVKKATNVLIGDKSQFLTKDQSLDVVADDNDSDSCDDSYTTDDRTPANESTSPKTSSLKAQKSRTNIPVTHAEPKQSTSDVMGNVSVGSEPNKETSVGFAECLTHVSSRQPVEGSENENFSDQNEREQTYRKEFCNLSYILNK